MPGWSCPGGACSPRNCRRQSAVPLALVFCLFLSCTASLGLATSSSEQRPVPLADILAALTRNGAQLIYSTQLVPPALKAVPPPPGLPLAETLRRLLTPLGLEARALPNGAFVIAHAAATQGMLTITVVLERAGQIEPLPKAAVELAGARRRAVSDDRGQVVFENLPWGRYRLRARFDGLEAVQRTVELTAAEAVGVIELRMTWLPATLAEIRIEASRPDAGATSASVTDRDTIESSPTTSSDAARALQLLPGAAVAGYTAKTHVRGSRDDETLFRFDGLDVADPYHLGALQSLSSIFDPVVIDSATAWSGLAPVRYPGAIGAVVDMQARTVADQMADVRLSNRDAAAAWGTPLASGRVTVFAAARLTNDLSPEQWLESNTDSRHATLRDYLLRTTWDAGPGTRVAAGFFATEDQRETLTVPVAPEDQRAQFASYSRYAWLRVWQTLTPFLGSETFISGERSHDSAAGTVNLPAIETGELSQADRRWRLTLREQLSLHPGPDWSLLFGAEWQDANVAETLSSQATFQPPFVPGLQPVAVTSLNADAALRASAFGEYLTFRWQRAERTIVDLGVRHDSRHFDSLAQDDGNWSGSVNVSQQLASASRAWIGWGQTTQADIGALAESPDGTLRPPPVRVLSQANAAWEQALARDWLLRIEAYDKRERTGLQTSEDVFTPFALLPQIALGSQWVDSSGARMRGLEMHIESDRLLPLSGWLSCARSTAEDRISGQWVPRSWDQPDALQLGGRWWSGPWQATGIFSWHTGWPTTPLLVSSTAWQNPGAVSLQLAPRNSARLPDPLSLDVRLSWDHALQTGSLQIALELNDLTGARIRCCSNYSVLERPDGSSQLVDTPGYWLGFAAKLTLRWRL
jgi:hypothetical protein